MRVDDDVGTPDGVEDLVPRERLSGVPQQVDQEVELLASSNSPEASNAFEGTAVTAGSGTAVSGV